MTISKKSRRYRRMKDDAPVGNKAVPTPRTTGISSDVHSPGPGLGQDETGNGKEVERKETDHLKQMECSALKPRLPPRRKREKHATHQQMGAEADLVPCTWDESIQPGAQYVDGCDIDDPTHSLVAEQVGFEIVAESDQTTATGSPAFDVTAEAVMIDEPVQATSVDIYEFEKVEKEENRGSNKRRLVLVFVACLALVGATTGLLVYFLSKPSLPPSPDPPPIPPDGALEDFIQSKSPSLGKNSSSPQRQALNWLVTDPYTLGFWVLGDERRVVQRFALATLFFSTGGDKTWKTGSEWLGEGPECKWQMYNDDRDLSCNSQDMVQSLSLWGDGLSGSLPGEIGLLSDLVFLDLYNNTLEGTIPSEIGLMMELKVFTASHNNLEGPIPSELGQLTKLERLLVDGNHLTGSLSSSTCDLLEEIKTGCGISCECCFCAIAIPVEGGRVDVTFLQSHLFRMELWFETTEPVLKTSSILQFRSVTEEYIEMVLRNDSDVSQVSVDMGVIDQVYALHRQRQLGLRLQPLNNRRRLAYGYLGVAFDVRIAFQARTNSTADNVEETVAATLDSRDDTDRYLTLLKNAEAADPILAAITEVKQVKINDAEVFSTLASSTEATDTGSRGLTIVIISICAGMLMLMTAELVYRQRNRQSRDVQGPAPSTRTEPGQVERETVKTKRMFV